MAGCHTEEHARKISEALKRRFASKSWWLVVDRGHDTPCWIWQRALNEKGYGRVSITTRGRKKTYVAHRYVFEQHRGPIPDGMTLDHVCRQRDCVNPEHLEPVTQRENVRRGLAWRTERGLPRYAEGTR